MKILKTFETETAHIVRDAVSERCKFNIHGHSYKWEVVISSGPLTQLNGMVLDFKELKPIKEFIDLFDHATVFWSRESPIVIDFFKDHFKRVLVMRKNPTAENMARLIMKYVTSWLFDNNHTKHGVFIDEVKVWETRTGCGIAEEFDSDDVLDYRHGDQN